MPRVLYDHRGLSSRLPERPGLLRRLAAPVYGRVAGWAGAWQARRQVVTRIPVLSVGNLEVGGTGKTPAVAALAGLLMEHGRAPGILTGMTGPCGGRRLLLAGDPDFEGWAPDEARLLARRLPGLPVLAARRKWEGALRLDREKACDLICLDDGFQHRRLARHLDLVLLSEEAALGSLSLLPAGPLREGRQALARAHAFLLPAGAEAVDLPARPCFRFRIVPEGFFDWAGHPVEPDPEGYVSAAAIARPERFEDAASKLCNLIESLRFKDHAAWHPGLRRHLAAALLRQAGARILLTEKDAARWSGSWDLKGKAPHVLRIRLEWQDPEALWHWLDGELRGPRGRRELP